MEPRTGIRLVVLLVGCFACLSLEFESQLARVKWVGDIQRPPEGPASDGTVDAFEGGMHPRTSTRKGTGGIRNHLTVLCNAPQQC